MASEHEQVSKMVSCSKLEECYRKYSGRMEMLHNTGGVFPVPRTYIKYCYGGVGLAVADGIDINHHVVKSNWNKSNWKSKHESGFILDKMCNELLNRQNLLFDVDPSQFQEPEPIIQVQQNRKIQIFFPQLNINNLDNQVSIPLTMLSKAELDESFSKPKNNFNGLFYKRLNGLKKEKIQEAEGRKTLKKPLRTLTMFEEKVETKQQMAHRLVNEKIKLKKQISPRSELKSIPAAVKKGPIFKKLKIPKVVKALPIIDNKLSSLENKIREVTMKNVSSNSPLEQPQMNFKKTKAASYDIPKSKHADIPTLNNEINFSNDVEVDSQSFFMERKDSSLAIEQISPRSELKSVTAAVKKGPIFKKLKIPKVVKGLPIIDNKLSSLENELREATMKIVSSNSPLEQSHMNFKKTKTASYNIPKSKHADIPAVNNEINFSNDVELDSQSFFMERKDSSLAIKQISPRSELESVTAAVNKGPIFKKFKIPKVVKALPIIDNKLSILENELREATMKIVSSNSPLEQSQMNFKTKTASYDIPKSKHADIPTVNNEFNFSNDVEVDSQFMAITEEKKAEIPKAEKEINSSKALDQKVQPQVYNNGDIDDDLDILDLGVFGDEFDEFN